MSHEVPFRALPLDQTGVRYAHGPDSTLQEGVPPGTTTSFEWSTSAVYPGTTRVVSVHVPAGCDPAEPASLLVFQDGQDFLDPGDEMRATAVLDNLVHRGHIPPTIGVFVDPGGGPRRQRNVEYDAFDDRYVTLLLDEVLPEVGRHWALTDDPDRRGLCGFSSGGSAALTAAWMRPDSFRRVVCFSGSFAQMPGGNPYPALVADGARLPLRVLLQVGHRDLGWDDPEANWLVDNLRLAAALVEATYDVRLVLGDGGHDGNHGGVLLPDALRWAFRANGSGMP